MVDGIRWIKPLVNRLTYNCGSGDGRGIDGLSPVIFGTVCQYTYSSSNATMTVQGEI